MAYLTREDIPFHYALADAFTVCDAYHCSFIGATDPNRYYMWTGYTGNDGTGGGPVLGNDELGYDWTTYPERLERPGSPGRSTRTSATASTPRAPGAGSTTPSAATTATTRCCTSTSTATPSPATRCTTRPAPAPNVKAGERLLRPAARRTCKAGKLPQVSWIAAPEAFSEHPNWPANYGAWYISQVLDALTSNPEVWSEDRPVHHLRRERRLLRPRRPAVPAGVRRPGPVDGRRLDRPVPGRQRATRPARTASARACRCSSSRPWSKGGYVCSETFDHTSIIRFMERRFGVQRAQHLAVAPRGVRRPDLRVRLQPARTPRPPPLPGTDGYEPPDQRPAPRLHAGAARRPAPCPGRSAAPADPAAAVRPVRRRRARRRHRASSPSTFACGPRPAPPSTSPPATARTAPGRTPSRRARRSPTPGAPAPPPATRRPHVWGPNGFLRTWKGPGDEGRARGDGPPRRRQRQPRD